jgi:phosphate starvation-inducible PhoH-like protein
LIKQSAFSEIIIAPFDNRRLFNICGKFDENLRQLEKRLEVQIYNRSSAFKVVGEKDNVLAAINILKNLFAQANAGLEITHARIHLTTQEALSTMQTTDLKVSKSIKTPLAVINLRNENQAIYVNNMAHNDIIFGIGPAGTGKTFLAVAAAVEALEQHRVRRIVLVRPVVEAGEHLGFLPGDLSQKIDPYLRPLYDAFHEMYEFDKVERLLEQHVIEIAPLAYMRGRTLSDAFIILDESQNTTKEQMKMFLTRIGFNSTAVITGDLTQIDLPSSKMSGLKHAHQLLQNIPRINFTYFDSKDVVRHPIIQKIIDAYEKNEHIERQQ